MTFRLTNDPLPGVELASDTWLTPPEVIEACGPFDLDPCAAVQMPWSTASTMLTKEHDALSLDWDGMVWLNPPYGSVEPWIQKMALHDNGIAFVFAKTDTRWFQKWVLTRAVSLLFLKGRVTFHQADGQRGEHPSPLPSVLVSYGSKADGRLEQCGLRGTLIRL